MIYWSRAEKIFMANHNLTNSTINALFFNPLNEVYALSQSQRNCSDMSDLDYLKVGVSRCISAAKSGNDFLQSYRKEDKSCIRVSNFFEALKSPRRLANLASVNQMLRPYLLDHLADELAVIEELKGWHLYAGDGHYHKGAIFDPSTKADCSDRKASKSPVGHFFRLDLRTHHLGYLDLAQPDDGKKSEHDMKMLKRQDFDNLRGSARKGQKVFYLWDRACIDYQFWNQAKHLKGIYFATLEKSNSVTKYIRDLNPIDHSDPRNEGLVSDRLVESSKSFEVRQIIYIDPSTGTEYRYLTNEKTLPAWIVVLLYKHRWDIEKVFDQTKTKLEETRLWASSKTAKKAHALFLCLTHNLMLLLEEHLRTKESMVDTVEAKKKLIRERTRQRSCKMRKKFTPSFINNFFERATQKTFRFIRWLRDNLHKQSSYKESLQDLAHVWRCPIP